jgi:CBS domain-containing protein
MLYLSQVIGRPVRDQNGEPIGKVADLIVAVGERYPPVTGSSSRPIVGRSSFPGPPLRHSTSRRPPPVVTIDIEKFSKRPNEILLKVDLMDKQIVDIDGRKVVRVNDLSLDESRARSARGRGRRRRRPAPAVGIEGRTGPAAQPPPPDLREVHRLGGRRPGRELDRVGQAACAACRPAELHPADLATIMDQLAPRDRAGVLASLDDEAVADAMEEMDPDTQVEVLEDLEPERAADILEEMSPDDAADLVADLSDEARAEILALMEEEEAEEVQELLGYPEDSAGGIMTTEFIAIPATLNAGQTIERLRELEPDAETVYYLYVTDDDEQLVGVLSLRDLIVARPETAISEVMYDEPVAVGVLASQEEVAQVVARYNLLAVPVVDDAGRLAGSSRSTTRSTPSCRRPGSAGCRDCTRAAADEEGRG